MYPCIFSCNESLQKLHCHPFVSSSVCPIVFFDVMSCFKGVPREFKGVSRVLLGYFMGI